MIELELEQLRQHACLPLLDRLIAARLSEGVRHPKVH